MFLKTDHDLETAGGAGARALRAAPTIVPARDDWRARVAAIDWVPNLGARIGSADWWRGLATCTALCAASWALGPPLRQPLVGATPAPLAGADREAERAQGIAPLALGGDTGQRMAASDLVRPLAEAPERPRIELSATLGDGDALDRALARAGVSRADARAATRLVAEATPLDAIPSGTRISLTLGRRASRAQPRPLEAMSLRARFDLAVALVRQGDGFRLDRKPIAVDATPLRLRGLVGSSLYRSARAAGAPAKAVESYIRALATRLSIGRDVTAADSFDLVVERERAATGETRLGQLLYAGLDQGRRTVRLVHWQAAGERSPDWFDASGRSEREGAATMPVAGRITSSFGMRMHPLLGFMRMHKGIDIGAPWGSPVFAMTDGTVAMAGRNAGYGNFVKLAHAAGLSSGYGHLSRIAVAPGTRVRQGQVIGYVGSTGLSTGPHLHWEVWRNGQSVDPRRLSFASVQRLTGRDLAAFKQRAATLLALTSGR